MGTFLGWIIYLAACVAFLVFVSVPLALFGAVVAVPIGPVAVVVLAGVVLLGQPRAVCGPDQVADGALNGRVRAAFVRRDRAWPQYFAAQVRLDLAALAARTRGMLRLVWTVPPTWLEPPAIRVWWPLYLSVIAIQLAASAGLLLGLACAAAVVSAFTAVAWAAALVVVALLRTVDAGWQRIVHAEASCQWCFQISSVPAYRCLGPHDPADRTSGYDLHRELRPGRLGVLWRRCACGRRLPTMVLRAGLSRRLQACCPHCAELLPRGSGVHTDVRVPVFGAASAGKTQLTMSALVTLKRVADTRGVRMTIPDQRSKGTFREYDQTVGRGLAAVKTSASSAPVALTVRLAKGRRTALVHLFDAAGELLVDRRQNARLSYLDHARSLAFVLDPFSIPRIEEEFGASFADVFTAANVARHDPEDSYLSTVGRMQEYGVRTDRQRLAFVVTKADLLAKLPAGRVGESSLEVRSWLAGLGLDNLLLAAERDFGEVNYFLVASRNADLAGAFRPLEWVLEKEWTNLA